MARLGAVIISHENMRKRMAAPQNNAPPAGALPIVTYSESLTLHFNGEEIAVYHPEPAHTDGDSIIYFRHANVMHVGDVPASLPDRCRRGIYYSPTVIVGLPTQCRVMREEIFGPVVTITPFDSDDELLAMVNDVPYGLSASLWCRELNRAHRLAEGLEVGTVWVNCWLLRDLRTPFGGVKQSGLGREGGDEALRFFTEPKTVCIKT
jgi:hypothetical protein